MSLRGSARPSVVDWDHNATTPLRPEVRELLRERLESEGGGGGNPSSVHGRGRAARKRLEAARSSVARILGCEPREVCFTASGSEADAIALQGAWLAARPSGRSRVVVSAIEHPAVLAAAANLELLGAEVVRVLPGADGRVDAGRFLEAVGADTAIASLMWANNETGVLQPVAEVARACRQRGVPFHTDAVQAAGKVPVTLREVDADLLSLSGHKLGAPVGAGVLVVRRGVALRSVIPGHQEDGARGGTQAVMLIEALALALELAQQEALAEAERIASLRDGFERELLARVSGIRINGAGAPRIANTSHLQFEAADGEALLIALDLEGICASSGAACASGSLKPSQVLLAMGLTPAQAQASLRFSLGREATEEEVERVICALEVHVPRAREAARELG